MMRPWWMSGFRLLVSQTVENAVMNQEVLFTCVLSMPSIASHHEMEVEEWLERIVGKHLMADTS